MSTSDATDQRGLIRQGDVLLVPCDPDDLGRGERPYERRKVQRVAGQLILATGEATGHAHAIRDRLVYLEEQHGMRMARRYPVPSSPLRPIVDALSRRTVLIVEGESATLTHEEHDPLVIPPGSYEVRMQREYLPSGVGRRSWRGVRD